MSQYFLAETSRFCSLKSHADSFQNGPDFEGKGPKIKQKTSPILCCH